jgi:hypothetical protein
MRRHGFYATALVLGAMIWCGGSAGARVSSHVASAHVEVTSWGTQRVGLSDALDDVSCAGAGFCAAVGTLDPSAGSGVATTNGGAWVVSADPAASLDGPELRSVSCTSSSFCMAVGQYSDDATSSTATLTERWNGAGWQVVSSPEGLLTNSAFSSVSCTSSSFCLAVGESTTPGVAGGDTLAATWNGASWSALDDPSGPAAGAQLSAVSCVGPAFCLSLGNIPGGGIFGVTPIELVWSGSGWSVPDVSASLPPVGALSCASSTFCMAAADNNFMEWNGAAWSALPVTASSEDDQTNAITCTSSTFCVAVGSRDGHATDYETQTLVKEWNGTVWSYVPSADATALDANVLSGVSCTTSLCVAAGSTFDPNTSEPVALLESSVIAASAVSSGPISAPIVGMAATPDGGGYWLVGSDGSVYADGDAVSYGSLRGTHLNAPIVGMAATPDGGGYWLVGSDGGIFAFGDAGFFGSTGNLHLNKPVVGMTASPDGQGYWFVASDGGIFAFGDAVFYGSMGATHLNQPVVGMAVDNFNGGYWLVAADGGIFAFHAPFFGSTGALHLNAPIVGMEADPTGQGYRFVASDGGVFSFNLPFSGSAGGTHLNQPVVGMAAAGLNGYWLVARDGGIFAFGGAPFDGSPA